MTGASESRSQGPAELTTGRVACGAGATAMGRGPWPSLRGGAAATLRGGGRGCFLRGEMGSALGGSAAPRLLPDATISWVPQGTPLGSSMER